MKIRFIISCLFFSCLCFAHSPDVITHFENTKKMVEEGKIEDGIRYLNYLIQSNEIQDVDKIHYMIFKLNLISLGEDKEEQINIIKQINDLSKSNYLCYLELKYSYDLRYLCD